MESTPQTREQKLEAAFLQLIKQVVNMRRAQTDFDTHFGSHRRKIKNYHQDKVDKSLEQMGITAATDLKELKGLKIGNN